MEHLPKKMRASFDASISDPDLLSVRNELALTDARLHELLDRLTTGESGDRMARLSEAIYQIDNALRAPKPSLDSLRALARTARTMLEASFGEDSTWAKIQDNNASRIRLADSERKLAEMKQANVAADRLNVLMQQLLSSVRQHVIGLPGGSEAVKGVATDLLNMMGYGQRDVPEDSLN